MASAPSLGTDMIGSRSGYFHKVYTDGTSGVKCYQIVFDSPVGTRSSPFSPNVNQSGTLFGVR